MRYLTQFPDFEPFHLLFSVSGVAEIIKGFRAIFTGPFGYQIATSWMLEHIKEQFNIA